MTGNRKIVQHFTDEGIYRLASKEIQNTDDDFKAALMKLLTNEAEDVKQTSNRIRIRITDTSLRK